MTVSKLLLVSALALSLPGLAGRKPAETDATPALDPTPCELTALALRYAEGEAARADAWHALAVALNDPQTDLLTCVAGIRTALSAAQAAAEVRYRARLEACALLGHGAYHPQLDPTEFSPTIDHAHFPLPPGRTLVYEGQSAKGLQRIEVTVLPDTITVARFECRAVRSIQTLDGVLVEETTDWYAQRANGDVWSFGELSKQYEDGFLDSLEGSWRTGKDGARPGFVMAATPIAGAVCRRLYVPGSDEDLVRVVAVDVTVVVGSQTYEHCIQIEEWSPVEPDERDMKYYAPGVGLVLEVNQVTGERVELTQVNN